MEQKKQYGIALRNEKGLFWFTNDGRRCYPHWEQKDPNILEKVIPGNIIEYTIIVDKGYYLFAEIIRVDVKTDGLSKIIPEINLNHNPNVYKHNDYDENGKTIPNYFWIEHQFRQDISLWSVIDNKKEQLASLNADTISLSTNGLPIFKGTAGYVFVVLGQTRWFHFMFPNDIKEYEIRIAPTVPIDISNPSIMFLLCKEVCGRKYYNVRLSLDNMYVVIDGTFEHVFCIKDVNNNFIVHELETEPQGHDTREFNELIDMIIINKFTSVPWSTKDNVVDVIVGWNGQSTSVKCVNIDALTVEDWLTGDYYKEVVENSWKEFDIWSKNQIKKLTAKQLLDGRHDNPSLLTVKGILGIRK